MMPTPNLKLVDPRRENGDTIKLERRGAPRHRIEGRVTAILHAADEGEGGHQICSVGLRNISDNGLAAVADKELDLGTHITVVFNSHGPDRGFDLHGQVVRCDRRKDGYEVGIHLECQSDDRCVA